MDFFRLRRPSVAEAPPELVLAYLEEVQRSHVPCFAVDIKGSVYPVRLTKVTETGVGLDVDGPVVVRQGGLLNLMIYLDDLRFELKASVVHRDESEIQLAFPHSLLLNERRQRPRLTFKPQGSAHATLFTGLFEGKAISGVIENVSEGGLRLQLVQASSIKRKIAIPLVEDIVLAGEALPVIRLEDVPRCQGLEVKGKVVYLQPGMSRLYAGIAFNPGQEKLLLPLKELVESRTEPIPHSVPLKVRVFDQAPAEAPAAPGTVPLPEKANFSRLPVGSEYRLRFRAGGHPFNGMSLTELSAGGCSWLAGPALAMAMPPGTPLEALVIENRDLPVAELTAVVVQSAPKNPADPESVFLVEAVFTGTDPRIRVLFDQHVARKLAQIAVRRNEQERNSPQNYPSLMMPPGFTVRFRHQGTAYTAATLTELSAKGCTVYLSQLEARTLHPGALLALFKFDHGDLPSIPLQAQVVNVRVRPHAVNAEVCVEFVNINDRIRSSIHAYVLSQIGCEGEDVDAPMSYEFPSEQEQVLHPTLGVSSEYSCSFRLSGVAFQDIGLTTLSSKCCGFQIEVQRSGPFAVGLFTTSFHIHHPDLPQVPMQGCISRVIGKVPGRTSGYVLVTVDFVNINERLMKIIQDHVVQRLRGER